MTAWLILMFSEIVLALLYWPPTGLAAAMTEQRAERLHTMPAFATDTLCCSMASKSACSRTRRKLEVGTGGRRVGA